MDIKNCLSADFKLLTISAFGRVFFYSYLVFYVFIIFKLSGAYLYSCAFKGVGKLLKAVCKKSYVPYGIFAQRLIFHRCCFLYRRHNIDRRLYFGVELVIY